MIGVATDTGEPGSRKRRFPLWAQTLVGLVLGALTGLLAGERVSWLEPVGSLFIQLIKMLVVPLVFLSVACGIAGMRGMAGARRLGIKTLVAYFCTTVMAITIGLCLAVLLEPGAGMHLSAGAGFAAQAPPAPSELLLGLVPANPAEAFVTGNVLQLIVLGVLLGVAINLVGEPATPALQVLESLSAITYKLTDLVVALAPYGVFALIAVTAGRQGLATLLPLGKLVIAVYLGCLLHMLVTLGGGLALMTRLSPLQFFKGIFEAQLVAFSTTTAAGTLPVTMACARGNLGVSQRVAGFVLPVGTAINLDGTALYQALAAVFIAQAYGVELGPAGYMTIVLATTLSSVGTAALPGAGLMVLTIVLSAVGLPLEGMALIAGIDRILDMARTTVNVTGDAAISVVVAHSEGELDREVFLRSPQ